MSFTPSLPVRHATFLLALFVLVTVGASRLLAGWTLVDAGSSATFTANGTGSNTTWTLDGSPVSAAGANYTFSPDVDDVGVHVLQCRRTSGNSSVTQQWGIRVRTPLAASSVRYYVSPTGSDSNDGSIGSPFLTLEKARDVIRARPRPLPPGGVTVYLRAGTYFRNGTFTLNALDSGSLGAPIVYTAYPGEEVLISTGTRLMSSSFSPLAASEQGRVAPGVNVARIWEADASSFLNKGPYPIKYGTWPIRNSLDATTSVPDVFYNNSRAWLSRYPNHNLAEEYLTPNLKMNGIALDSSGASYLNGNGTYTSSNGSLVAVGGAFSYNSTDASRIARWRTALAKGGVWLQGYWRVTWQSDLAQVLDIDTGKGVITFVPNSSPSGGFGNKYTSTAGISGRPGNRAEPYWVVNLLEEMDQPGEWAIDFSRNKLYFLMDKDGAPPDGSVVVADFAGPVVQMNGVSNVVFQSLTIEKSLGIGMLLVGGSRNLVLDCTFRNISNMGVWIQGGTFNGVVSCDFNELGAMAIQISAPTGATSSNADQSNFVVNNKFTGLSRYAQVYQPAVNLLWPTAGNRIASNYVSDTPQMGVQFAGYRNLFEYNEITKYGTLVDDTGSFYSYEDYYGDDTFRYNFSYDTPLANAITFDGTNRIVTGKFYGNISQLSAACEGESVGLFLCGNVEVFNNISIGGGRYGGFAFSTDTRRNINNNVAVAGFYPQLDFVWKLVSVSNGNYVYTSSNSTTLGNGPNVSYPSDPGFVNLATRDLRLKPDAQLLSDLPDFQPIPFELIGLYNDEYRSDGKAFAPYIVNSPPAPASGPGSVTACGSLTYPLFDGNTSVKVYYGTTDGGTSAASWQNVVDLGSQNAGPLTVMLSGLDPTKTWFYRYFASNAIGSAWAPSTTSIAPQPVNAPSGVSAITGDAQVVLSWTGVPNATSYNIKRSTASGGEYVVIGTTSGTTFTDATVTNGTTYYYVISAASNTAETPNSAEATAAPLKLPVAWGSQDIGSTAFAGSSSMDPFGTFTVKGSGADIWGTADAFQFAGRAWSGDGVLVARIRDFTNTNAYTKVGVMFRESLLSNSKNVFAGGAGQGRTVMQIRTAAGGSTSNSGNATSGALPRWIRLVRSGNTFTAFQSGTTSPAWVQLGNTANVTMSASCYAGLAVSSHDNTKVCTARFDNLIFLATPGFVTGLGQATLTWIGSPGAVSYQVQRSTTSGGNYTTVATVTNNTSFTDTGLTNGTAYYYVITATATQNMTATSPQVMLQPGVLNAPTGLTGTPGYAQATLSWTAPMGAVSYNIKRSTTSGTGYVTIGTTNATSFVDTAVSKGTTYYYIVTAVSSWAAEGSPSTEVPVGVGPLQNTGFETPSLTTGTFSYNTANGSWTFSAQSGTNGSGISTNNSTFTRFNANAPEGRQVAFLQGNGTISQTINGLVPGGNYTLTFSAAQVQSSNLTAQRQTFQIRLDTTVLQTYGTSAGNGTTVLSTGGNLTDYALSFSPTATSQVLRFVGTNSNGGNNTVLLDNIRVVLQSPAAPTGLTVTSDFGQPTLNWSAVGGATAYNVKRSLSRDAGYSVIVSGLPAGTTGYSDPVEIENATYYYKVSASNPGGEGPDSLPAAAPAITVPAPVLVIQAEGSGGSTVNFATTAVDMNGAAVPTTDQPASGSLFPLGDTAIITSASDALGNRATAGFTVSVVDTKAPDIQNADDIVYEATGSSGANVPYAPTATDAVDGPVPVTCTPPSGTLFPLGASSVTVNATDSSGNAASKTFTVTVVDTTPPLISVPSPIFVDAVDSNGAPVTFSTSAYDVVSGVVPTTTSHVSGSTFPIGRTTVTVNATDTANNSATRQFTITVLPLPLQKADNNTALSSNASWTGGRIPGTSDTALWSGNYSSASANVSIGTGLAVERLRVNGGSRAITISASSGSLTLLGASGTGVDMANATQDFTVAAPVRLGNSQAWNIPSGRTFAVSGNITEATASTSLTASGTGTIVLSGNNTFSGSLDITPPAGGLPVYKFGGNNAAAYVKLNAGANIGLINANGRLDVMGAVTIGTISGNNSSGLIANYSTTNNILSFLGNSSFSMFYFGADNGRATLQQSGPGNVTFSVFGYSPSNNSANSSVTFNGGSWILGQTGQNNTNAQMTGSAVLTNGANVTQTSQNSYTHGNWNIANGTLTLLGGTIQHADGKPSNLSFTINGTGRLIIPAGGLTLGNNNVAALSMNDSLTVGPGGVAIIGGSGTAVGHLQIGTTNNQTAETNTVTLAGGKLVVTGSISASSGAGQTRFFHWTGGQLTAFSIQPGTNFSAGSGSAGGLTTTGLSQTAGVLAPGDTGSTGRTQVLGGNYSLGANGTLACDIAGATASAAFQDAAGSSNYDQLTVSGTTTLAGNLSISLLNVFTPAANQTFTVLTSNGTLSGAFANVAFGNRVATTGGEGSFTVTKVGNTVVLGSYLALLPPGSLSAQSGSGQITITWSAPSNAPVGTTYSVLRAASGSGPFVTVASRLTTLTFTDTGLQAGTTYFYAVTANYGGVDTSPTAALVSARTFTPLEQWRLAAFGTTVSAGNAADTADPDGDGVPNLLEYVYSTDPKVANSLPAPIFVGISGNATSITFPRYRSDVSYIVEGSSDLSNWTMIPPVNPGTVGTNVTVTDNVPLSLSVPRRFLRLRITNP